VLVALGFPVAPATVMVPRAGAWAREASWGVDPTASGGPTTPPSVSPGPVIAISTISIPAQGERESRCEEGPGQLGRFAGDGPVLVLRRARRAQLPSRGRVADPSQDRPSARLSHGRPEVP
jgi:hypothetical protein